MRRFECEEEELELIVAAHYGKMMMRRDICQESGLRCLGFYRAFHLGSVTCHNGRSKEKNHITEHEKCNWQLLRKIALKRTFAINL